MKIKHWAIVLSSVSAFAFARSFAADPAPAAPTSTPAPAAAPAAAPEPSPVQKELIALVTKIKGRIQAGANTEAALGEDLKGFDAILAAHKSEKTDEVAQVLLMKALLYVQVFQDFDKGTELLKQLKADFPNTTPGARVDDMLRMLDKQKQSLAMKAAMKPGVEFPDFSEKSLTGEPLSLKQFKGKVVLVDFWATWCGPCVAELPNVLAAYQKYHNKGFEIVGVSLDQNKDTLEKFLKEKGMTWGQYFDGKGWENVLARKYGISSIPATFLIGTDGKIVAKDLRGEALEAELAKLLK
ncbi:TlpA family protein disulfide reductase [Opitutaceae bacterium EW11]|nr:TlpA family protein disulfide reductase [Opitutaceae bacterium EW11]